MISEGKYDNIIKMILAFSSVKFKNYRLKRRFNGF